MLNDTFVIPEIIAEIGVNYFDIATKLDITPLEAAKLMAKEAKNAGANIAKFQTYKAEKLAAKYSPAYWDLNEEQTKSQRELFQKYDKLDYKDFKTISEYCKEIDIEFMSTPFDAKSAYEINKLVNCHKIASADITNIELLQIIGSFKKPVCLSTGASTKEEIYKAIEILKKSGCEDITILHCVLNYPTPLEKANLWRITTLRNEFNGIKIGYSDHTKFDIDVLMTAALLGAKIIEKHFTLDKSLKGNDHYHAASPEDIKKLVQKFLKLNKIIGKENKNCYDKSEEISRINARRGVYLVRNVKSGDVLKYEDVEFLRPQGDGITPIEWDNMVLKGLKYSKARKKGEQIVNTI